MLQIRCSSSSSRGALANIAAMACEREGREVSLQRAGSKLGVPEARGGAGSASAGVDGQPDLLLNRLPKESSAEER